MFKSVFIKYVTAFLLINISCMLLMTSIITSIISTYSTNVKSRTLERAALYVYNTVNEGLERRDMKDDLALYLAVNPETVHSYLDSVSINVDEIVMLMVDHNGRIVLSGGADESDRFCGTDGILDYGEQVAYMPADYLENLKNNDSYKEITTFDGMFESEYLVYSVPFRDINGNFAGAVVASSHNSDMNILLSGMSKTIFMSTLWLMLAVLVVTYFISERLVSPIRAMSRAAKSFAKGQFDVRLPVRGKDEIAELVVAFNNMASSLASNEEMRRLFLANVSHDLRTPMTTISGFIDGILDGAIPKEKHEYYLGVIASEVRRLSRLVSALLDITKIQAGERKFTSVNFDICEMCRQVLISSEQRIEEKSLDVEFECDSDNMYALGDTDAIHQIVYNLMDNAIKFSNVGGKYKIKITENGQKIFTSVYNEGEGIPEADLPFVFDRFYKSDRSRGLDKTGVGLGLYIAKTIIDAHGETISVESEHGKWCRFTFTLSKGTSPRQTNLLGRPDSRE
ncbi:MAG: HAMP domain-containing protein [Clostridia bacterium]|nr:HAMP domain-containing protein [Clostridia bacterium]